MNSSCLAPCARRLIVAVVLLLWATAAAAAAAAPPNIVLIIGDDHAWHDAGFLGHAVALTPNLDALAAAGTVFSNAHNTASVCQPSLQTLLSGMHPVQWDARRRALEDQHGPIPRRQEVQFFRTLPRTLAAHGYRSFEGGKMWEGTYQQAGFTDGLATHIGSTFESIGEEFGREGIEPLREFLDSTATAPFFVWFAPMLPHRPFDAAARYREPLIGRGLGNETIDYYANLLRLDEVIGDLLSELDIRGLRDNTLIVYVSDNGWEIGQFWTDRRGGKSTLHELGVRTPLIFQLPGVVPAGAMREDMISTEDLVPTLLAFAGVAAMPGLPGRSLHGAITAGAPVGRRVLVSEHLPRGEIPGGIWVRTPGWRYLGHNDGSEELFAIARDPAEAHDLSDQYPELLPYFRAQAALWRRDIRRRNLAPLVCRAERRDARKCFRSRLVPGLRAGAR